MNVPLLINDFLRRAAKLYPRKLAVVDGPLRLSYGQLRARVNQLAHALRALGVGQGDRVCVLSPNSHYFIEAFYGVSQIGAILVPLNFRLSPEEHLYIIDHCGAVAVLADHDQVAAVEAIRPRLAQLQHLVVAGAATAPPGWHDWDALLAAQPAGDTEPVAVAEDDVFSINYTSGTTARPKGVMLTHRNCYLNALNLIIFAGLRHDDVELWTLPLFHANGWGGVFAITALGATHVVLRAVVAADIFRLIAAEGVTFACMAPAVLAIILGAAERAAFPIRTRPRCMVAGAPPPVAYIERLERELGWTFLQIYGLTETSPILTISQPDSHDPSGQDWERRGRAGVEALDVDLQVVDEAGRPVPKDDRSIGEVVARSNVVMKGYWLQPDESARALAGGYFHSGDLAVWDEFANIQLVDRKKDVIISGGENISSPEVEGVLYRHPAVLECAVIGVPSERWGETPKALVVLRPGQEATEAALIDFVRAHLAHFKCPSSVEFVTSLPRTATGKLQKFLLRERYWQGHSRRVH